MNSEKHYRLRALQICALGIWVWHKEKKTCLFPYFLFFSFKKHFERKHQAYSSRVVLLLPDFSRFVPSVNFTKIITILALDYLVINLKYKDCEMLLVMIVFWDHYKVPGSSITKVVTIVTFNYLIVNLNMMMLKYCWCNCFLVPGIITSILHLALQKFSLLII